MSRAFALQKAIFERLTPVLSALVPPVAVVDHGDEQSFPFVEISRVFSLPEHNLVEEYTRFQVALTVYSDKRGQKQVHDILEVVDLALDDSSLTLSEGGLVVRIDRERADTARDQDGLTYVGSALYSILVKHG